MPEALRHPHALLTRERLSLPELLKLPYQFEVGFTDHDIAKRMDVPYYGIHRVYLIFRKTIQAYEDQAIRLLEGEIEVDETTSGRASRTDVRTNE